MLTKPKFEIGDKVYHRNLQLHGVVLNPIEAGLGIQASSTLVYFEEEDECLEVSTHLLDKE